MKITQPQRKALENLASGRSSYHGLIGSSAMGGHDAVMKALARKGWVTWVPGKGHHLTSKGREALKP